jgi:hypothetical protein
MFGRTPGHTWGPVYREEEWERGHDPVMEHISWTCSLNEAESGLTK